MSKNIYIFVRHQVDLHGSWLNVTYAWIQNVISRMLSINNIYESMAAATHLDQEVVLWFDAGRLFRILAIFPPIELEDPEEDWYYNVRNSPYYYSGNPTTPTPSMTITQPGT